MALAVSGCGGKAGSAAPTTTVKARSGPTPGLGLTAKSCGQLINIPETFTNAVTGLPSNLSSVAGVLKHFARVAPFEVRPAFKVLATASVKIATILKGVDLNASPTPSVIVKLKRLSTDLNTGAITDSGASVSAWAQLNCGTTSR